MSMTLEDYKQKAEEAHGRYTFRFANHPRVTRDLNLLQSLITDTEALLKEIEHFEAVNGSSAAKEELLETVRDRLELYKKEYQAIEEAQSAGDAVQEAAILSMRANFVINKYRRHFAGQERHTRDVGLLEEMIEDLKKIKSEMKMLNNVQELESLTNDLKVVEENLELYEKEKEEILIARTQRNYEEQASNLATLANAQFQVYADHFAGKARVSRRPEFLERIIKNLKAIRDAMVEISRHYNSEVNLKNIGIVEDRLKAYEAELKAIKETRRTTTLEDLAGHLGSAANEIFEAYRQAFAGKPRTEVSKEKMILLCDQLSEIERQMHEISLEKNIPTNLSNLAIVRDTLVLYEREYQEIEKAQSGS